MAGIDDLDFEGIVEGALSDEDDTAKFDSRQLLRPKSRKPLRTPVLSGRKMASESSHHLPLAADDDVDTTEEMIDTSRLDPVRSDFDRIYEKAGLGAQEFTVFKLAELFEDEELAELDDAARRAAVRAILKSHGVELQDILDDAVARRAALERQDEKMREGVNTLSRSLKKENNQLQAEIEEFANPRLARMEANDERAEKARQNYRGWVERKQREFARINEIIDPWGGDDRLRVTEKVEALDDDATAPSREASPQPISIDDVFDAPAAFESASEAELEELEELSASSDGEWSFGETSEGLDEPSVQTELPSEYEMAVDEDPSITGSFEIRRPGSRVVPRTPVQGVVAALATIAWLFAGGLLSVQLTMFLAPAAIGIAFGGPVVLATLLVLIASAASARLHFFSALLVSAVVAFGAAHHDPQNLVESFSERPIWVVDEAGLNDVEEPFHRLFSPYIRLITDQLGIETAPVDEGSP